MRKRPRSTNLKEASTEDDESEGGTDSGMDEIVGKSASTAGRSRPKGKGKGKAKAKEDESDAKKRPRVAVRDNNFFGLSGKELNPMLLGRCSLLPEVV